MALSTGRTAYRRTSWFFAVVGVTQVEAESCLPFGLAHVIAVRRGLAQRQAQMKLGGIFRRHLRVVESGRGSRLLLCVAEVEDAEQVAARDRGRHPGCARHEGQAGGPGT
jgi:hypothetical protein